MSLLEDIKIKSQQIAMKTDTFIKDKGLIASNNFVAIGLMAGISVMTSVATSNLSNIGGPTVLGVPISNIELGLSATAVVGYSFLLLASLYRNLRKDSLRNDNFEGFMTMRCTDNNNEIHEIPTLKFYEMIENGKLKTDFKEVIGYINKGKYYEGQSFPSDITLEQASKIQGEENCEKIRRLLMKQTNNMEFAKSVKNKIKDMRENLHSNNSIHPKM